MRRLTAIFALAAAVACAAGSKDDSPTDTDATDVPEPTDTTDVTDEVEPTDVGTDETDVDTEPEDTANSVTDPGGEDSGVVVVTDRPHDTGGFGDCPYLSLSQYLVQCGGDWRFVNEYWAQIFRRPALDTDADFIVIPITDQPDPGDCPLQYGFGGPEGEDMGQVLADAQCSDTCVYVAQQAVMVLYCGSRGEYITWGQGGPGQTGSEADCPPMIEGHTVAGDGFYATWEDYQAAHPCP